MFFKGKDLFKFSNHPVHILDNEEKLSPSSFVPFCEFGGNVSSMGSRIPDFDIPVCNSLKERVLNDQLCYEVDPNDFKNPADTSAHDIMEGLTLLIDLNEDRTISNEEEDIPEEKNKQGLNIKANQISKKEMTIFLDTLGKLFLVCELALSFLFPRTINS